MEACTKVKEFLPIDTRVKHMCCDEVTALYEWEEGRDSFFAEYGRDPNHEYELRKMRVDIL